MFPIALLRYSRTRDPRMFSENEKDKDNLIFMIVQSSVKLSDNIKTANHAKNSDNFMTFCQKKI